MSAAAGYETLIAERRDAVLHVTLNRPDRRNAVTHRMMLDLTDVFRRAGADAALRVVVLRGAGGHFSAGGDLDVMRDRRPDPSDAGGVSKAYRQMGEALATLDALPQAVVAVVEGACVGAGLGLVCAADYAIGRADAKFGMPEARAGFIPSQILPSVVRRIGEGQARRLGVMARVIDGREAHRIGVLHDLVETSAAADAALDRALDDLAWAEPQAVGEIKRLIAMTATAPRDRVLDAAADSLARLLASPEAAEGIAAFKAKRPPWWTRSRTP